MHPNEVNLVDEVLRVARSAEPPALDELEMRRLSRAALAATEATEVEARAPRGRMRTAWLALAALSLLSLCALLLVATEPQGTAIEVGRKDRALRLALRSGDVVIAAPGAALEIPTQDAIERRVHVQRGTALFDVVPLEVGQMFEVETHDARIRVLGTVFSVEVTGGRTIVRVYEGRVYVAGKTLKQGEVWVSFGAMPASNQAPLAAEGEHQAFLRGVAPLPARPGPTPSVLPLPRTVPMPTPDSKAAPEAPAPPDEARVYAEATRRLYSLGDAEGALGLVDAYDLDAESGLFRERASVLRVDALLRLGRMSQAAEVARRYVLREPETHTTARMRALAAGLVPSVTARE